MEYELYHHGIKGQKWGVRRFENEDGTLTPAGKERYGRTGEGRKHRDADEARKNKKALKTNGEIKSKKTHYSEDAQYFKDQGDKAIKDAKIRGVAVTALGVAALVGVGAYVATGQDFMSDDDMAQLIATGVLSSFAGGMMLSSAHKAKMSRADIEKKAEKSEFKSLADIPKATTDYAKNYFDNPDATGAELMKGVNPGYPNTGSTANCMLCTSAMIMRLKGYDVRANTSESGYESFAPEDWFDNCEVKRFRTGNLDKEAFINTLKDQGEGSYGNLMVSWSPIVGGGGHSILYTVKNNEVHFIDAQPSQEYSLDSIWAYIDVDESSYVRMNDAEPKEVARGLVLRNK